MTDARELTATLGGRWHGRFGTCACPVCQPDRRRGQNALTLADGRNGRLVADCKKKLEPFSTFWRRLACALVTIAPRTRQPLPSANAKPRRKRKSGRRKPSDCGSKPSPSRARWRKPICAGVASLAPCPRRCAFIPNAGTGQPRSAIRRWWRLCKARACLRCIAPTCARMARARRTLNRQKQCWAQPLAALCGSLTGLHGWWRLRA